MSSRRRTSQGSHVLVPATRKPAGRRRTLTTHQHHLTRRCLAALWRRTRPAGEEAPTVCMPDPTASSSSVAVSIRHRSQSCMGVVRAPLAHRSRAARALLAAKRKNHERRRAMRVDDARTGIQIPRRGCAPTSRYVSVARPVHQHVPPIPSGVASAGSNASIGDAAPPAPPLAHGGPGEDVVAVHVAARRRWPLRRRGVRGGQV